jgi:hypothetical protein
MPSEQELRARLVLRTLAEAADGFILGPSQCRR